MQAGASGKQQQQRCCCGGGGLGASLEFKNLVNEAIRLSTKDQQARVVASINLAAAASDGIRVRGSSEDDGIRVTASQAAVAAAEDEDGPPPLVRTEDVPPPPAAPWRPLRSRTSSPS